MCQRSQPECYQGRRRYLIDIYGYYIYRKNSKLESVKRVTYVSHDKLYVTNRSKNDWQKMISANNKWTFQTNRLLLQFKYKLTELNITPLQYTWCFMRNKVYSKSIIKLKSIRRAVLCFQNHELWLCKLLSIPI